MSVSTISLSILPTGSIDAECSLERISRKAFRLLLQLKRVSSFVLHLGLSEQFAYQFSMDIGQAKVAALEAEGEFFVIQTK